MTDDQANTDYANEDWLTIRVMQDEEEAGLAEGFLRSEGLPVQLESRYSHEFPTHLGHLGEIAIKVPESRAEEARKLLETQETAAGKEKLRDAAGSTPKPAKPGEEGAESAAPGPSGPGTERSGSET